MKARELAKNAVKKTFTFDREREFVLDNGAFMIAEEVYEDHLGRPEAGVKEIFTDLSNGKQRALMAITFAGLKRADPTLKWDEFFEFFNLGGLTGLNETLTEAVAETLPEAEGDNSKN